MCFREQFNACKKINGNCNRFVELPPCCIYIHEVHIAHFFSFAPFSIPLNKNVPARMLIHTFMTTKYVLRVCTSMTYIYVMDLCKKYNMYV